MSIVIAVIAGISLAVTAVNLILTAVLFRQLGVFVMGTARGANDSGISVGRRLPELQLLDARTGEVVDPHDGRPKLLFFGSTTCRECARIYPDIKHVEDRYEIPVVHFIFGRDVMDVTGYADKRGISGPVVSATEEIAHAYDVEVNPFAFVIDGRGVVTAKGLLNGRDQLIDVLAPIKEINFAEENEEAVRDHEVIATR
ncbi:TlpA family protein disulfide reductase [Actinomadura sp. HBU206391]|uniref:TlpA family protein disulfide reductase n=1 Tax=Actinomadura sp. HBU206391 TaxID=2731692 RepID=UPI001650B94E|nr:methylamine dehydrogenase [Actinomadura sp. HBU206391]MBC6458636.1 methylamine dehydrogenase [Actinomadura sp. HBU206391]